MRLLHYSSKPIALPLYSRDQDPVERMFTFSKPKGLWFSVEGEDDWPHWCQAENFNLEALAVTYEIILSTNAKIVQLSNTTDIDLFTERYGQTDNNYALWSKGIIWPKVANDYHGIIIAPYIWSRRCHETSTWYYGWDCACGCIWDVSAIAEFKAL